MKRFASTRIAAYTCDGITSASARLRSFFLFHYALVFGLQVSRELSFIDSFQCDQLHLQKCYRPQFIFHAIVFRCIRRTVVFDIDDQPENWLHRFLIIAQAKVATIVTTDTDARRRYLLRYLNKSKIIVLPDVLDIDPGKDIKTVFRCHPAASKGILWAGHRGNLASVSEFLHIIESMNFHHMTVVTNLTENDKLHAMYPAVRFVQWTLGFPFGNTIDSGFMVLNHFSVNNPDSMYKSSNKMVLAIAAGMIPFVSRSPAYVDLAIALDAEILIFDDFMQIFEKMNLLTQQWKHNFISRAQQYILKCYSSKQILLEYMSMERLMR